ncbi:MAG: hypothetical protein IPG59_20715 [Candidatus Melainabacteria bacterium]|nr:MAG: hypothetical protein IPG59_20715 [Candidatus Melainabacteria bacterium]
MELSSIIPNYQPLPLPAPLWLLTTLLILGFYLHVLPMNVILGGTFLSSFMFFKSAHDKNSRMYEAAKTMASILPVFVSFTITQGIVPLLFLQLLYGPMFYTSSIIMAVPWIGIIALLIVAYYGCYFVIYRLFKQDQAQENAGAIGLVLLISCVLFMLIGFTFSSNMLLMTHPEKWLEYYNHSSNGLNFHLNDPQLIPRYLHFFLSAIAVASLFMGYLGTRKIANDHEQGTWMIKKGASLFSIITSLQIGVGFFFLFSLPRDLVRQFMSGEGLMSWIFFASLALSAVSIILGYTAASSGNPKHLRATFHTTLLVILTMVLNRHFLREALLSPYIKPETLKIQPQWDLLGIFILSAVGLIVYLVWLVKVSKPDVVAEAE